MLRKFLSRIAKYWKPLTVALLSFAFIWAVLQWVILYGYSLPWTGFGSYTTPNGEFVRGKTLWDWMELFIIPIFLAIGAFLLNRSERESERQRAEEHAKLEREIATDRQQEASLQSYLDRMADLMLKQQLKVSENKELGDIARIRTLTALSQLDERRKSTVLRFLKEVDLITRGESVVNLVGADLEGAKIDYAFLQDADLQGAYMKSAQLESAKLQGANMKLLHLGFAHLKGAQMQGSTLKNAVMHGADLENANLQDADLESAMLQYANLKGANLSGANLAQAELLGAEVSDEQLSTVKSLAGTTMPDGTKHD